MKKFPKEIIEVLNILNINGYEAYVVGGASRDFLLGKKIYDVDINTDASSDTILKLFKNNKTYDIGKSLGTISVVLDKYKLDITPFRKDGRYLNHRRPLNVDFDSNLSEDLKRRDFSINALCIDSNMNIIDHYDGLKDLKRKTIKAIGVPQERFDEDALRILRAIRFSAQLDFKIEKNTKDAILKSKDLLNSISSERKKDELLKTLSFNNSYKLLKEYKTVFETFINFTNVDKKVDKLNNPLYKIAYMINEDELSNLKRLTFSKQELSLIKALINVKDIKLNDEYLLIKNLSNKTYRKDIMSFLSALHNVDIKEKANKLKRYFVSMDTLKISGEELIKLGYSGKNISLIKEEIIKEIHNKNLNNTKSSIKNYLKDK